MHTLNLIQGTPEWHAHRATHDNASDAPAMMGCSPYKTRQQLLHQRAMGLSDEVDARTQALFDEGHRTEALARSLAEQIIGAELYPCTGTDGNGLSASFDGLTMLEDTGYEHKMLNARLREAMHEGCTGESLPLDYQVQCEQQCMVAESCDRILFLASKWDGDRLVEERHCWYYPNPELAAQIRAGWAQFHADLAAYVPPEVAPPAPTGRAPETLPALRIEVTGTVTASNLDAFKQHALSVFKGINRELKTDNDFADAEKTVKWCGDVEERLAAAKQHALSQTESIDALFRTIDDISAEARRVRLDLDRLVKARKEEIRGEIVAEGVTALRAHIDSLNTRLGQPYMPTIAADFGAAIKGKKNIDSMRDAVATTLANAKIEANRIADTIDANLKAITAAGAPHLFNDLRTLVLKQADDLAAVIAQRLAAEQQRQEAERERIRQQEAARVEREHQAQLQRERAAAEAAAKAAAPAPAPEPVAALAVAPAVARASVPLPPAPAANEAPTLKLGQINERLGFMVGVDLLARLGFPATAQGASRLYRESDFPRICAALAAHVQKVCMAEAA
ncbi:YqaJ viral recombinase family protein [Aquincola tertiaricarbonis]|uniref:YqaJ viral recombinase family protein n=1 Tax=Aquincola tertiaricarbonis TaxID=391953 RepID=A0ABY4S8K1_AQUTE|nr:YqaJ viral recombinase family protein [Aquincola tertiaricarbonis]URI08784.1 YqaJ viral recombinase family protein [Aquincola tertiaricarbonis]